MTEPDNTSDYVGTPPGALPDELGGTLAMVGNREAEGDDLPEGAEPFDPKPAEVPQANADYTSTPTAETADQAAVEDAKPTKRRSRNE